MTTGPPKTDGAHGEHWLSPTVLALSNATEPATPSDERGAELADVLRPTLSLRPRRQSLRCPAGPQATGPARAGPGRRRARPTATIVRGPLSLSVPGQTTVVRHTTRHAPALTRPGSGARRQLRGRAEQ